jgi:hypothetical protein
MEINACIAYLLENYSLDYLQEILDEPMEAYMVEGHGTPFDAEIIFEAIEKIFENNN